MNKTFKKILSILILTTLFINTLFINSVFATDELTRTEFSESQIRKIKADIEKIYTSDEDKADAFFVSIGVGERWLKNFTKEYKTDIYRTANSVGMLNEYFVESVNGTTRKITEKEYNIQKNIQKTKDAAKVSRSVDLGSEEETDSYFRKTLVWIGTTDNSGYYDVITAFEWLAPPINRGVDALFLSATTGTFDSSTSGCAIQYNQTVSTETDTVTTEITDEYDDNDSNNILRSSNYIGYKFNLPNNYATSTSSVYVSDLAIMMACGYYVENPQFITNFSLLGSYFHRTRTLSVSVSVDSSSYGNITLSPQTHFQKYVVDATLTYTPQ